MAGHKISANALKKARKAFEANEPRNLFYRAATELVDLALQGAMSLTVAEALAVLLQTWNKAYYQYHKFDNVHFTHIENLLTEPARGPDATARYTGPEILFESGLFPSMLRCTRRV